MTGDVLEHDDGIVDHEAGGHRQRHERQVVEAIAQEIHRPEGADERHRHRHRGDDRRADAPQEREDHQRHQTDRDQERPLHVAQRGPDGRRPIEDDREIDGGGGRGLELRHQRAETVHGLDDVRPGLPEDDQEHGGLSVRQPGRLEIFDRVLDAGHVRQPDRLSVPVGDDDGHVVRGVEHLIVGPELTAITM